MTDLATSAPKPWSARAYYSKLTPDARREYFRRGNLAKWGLTPDDYDEMLLAQDGVCAICHRPETRKGRSGLVERLAIDHAHDTGRIRGLLCHHCNTALGQFDEDPDRLLAAIAYLKANT